MDVLAWILSGLLAALFLTAGLKKATTPREELLANMPSLAGFSTPQVKAIGTLEILGAIGLVLPWLLDIAPVLSGVAALGLAALMAGAMLTHARREELRATAPINVTLMVMAVVVAVLRFGQL